MKIDKQHFIVAAIYRMLKKKRIGFSQATELLRERARFTPKKATQLTEIWGRYL